MSEPTTQTPDLPATVPVFRPFVPKAIDVIDGPPLPGDNRVPGPPLQNRPGPPLPPELEEVARGGRARRKPSRVSNDIWQFMQEYVQYGGLLDLSEEISSIVALEMSLTTTPLAKGETQTARTKALLSLVETRARLKTAHMNMLQKRRDFITYDAFAALMQDFYTSLYKNVGDQTVIQAIGVDMANAARALKARAEAA